METKTEYAVDLKIPRPHEIRVDKESPTLKQLKEYRSIWLQEAEEIGRVKDVFKIVKALGTETDVSNGKLYIGALPLMLVEKGVKMVFWPQTKHLEIFEAERCWASIHGPGSAISKADDFYIPGPWQSVLHGLAGKADKKMIEISQYKAQQERDHLIDTLLGGSL